MIADKQPNTSRDPWYDIFTPPDPDLTADCAYHPGRVAMGACAGCGSAICIECRYTVSNRPLCPICAVAQMAPPPEPAQAAEAAPQPEPREAPPAPAGDDFVIRFSGTHRRAA